MTEAQAKILIGEFGVVALSSLMAIGGTVLSWLRLKQKAAEVIEQVT